MMFIFDTKIYTLNSIRGESKVITMKPEDFRQLVTQIGTPVGLIGDYGGPSDWSHGELLKGVLTSYLVAERQDYGRKNPEWDTGAIVILDDTLTTIGNDNKPFVGQRLLVFHRYPEPPWDNSDPVVFIYGIQNVETISNPPLKLEVWQPDAVWLTGAAVMTIEDPLNLSEMAVAFRRRAMRDKGEL